MLLLDILEGLAGGHAAGLPVEATRVVVLDVGAQGRYEFHERGNEGCLWWIPAVRQIPWRSAIPSPRETRNIYLSLYMVSTRFPNMRAPPSTSAT